MLNKIYKTDKEWRRLLSEEQYRITRGGSTECAFSSHLANEKQTGEYICICCKTPLFASNSKFDSGTGWPSFFQPIEWKLIKETIDKSLAKQRIEISCAICDAHLGHEFNDGPKPTGLRFCLNGASLEFKPD